MIKVVFSYDYELGWGVWNSMPISYLSNSVANANSCAASIMDVHEKHKICATWAVVGAAIDHNLDANLARSALGIDKRSAEDQMAFDYFIGRKDLHRISSNNLKRICETPQFEFASHTYWHKYSNSCLYPELTDDFEMFSKLHQASSPPVTIVFPRNIVTPDAKKIAREFGYRNIRINPPVRLYRRNRNSSFGSQIIRIVRLLDSFIPIQEYQAPGVDKDKTNGGDQIGQYFFRGSFNNRFLDWLHIKRLLFGLRVCLKRKTCFHVWSHPHNFGSDPSRSIENLDELLVEIGKLSNSGNLVSKIMRDV